MVRLSDIHLTFAQIRKAHGISQEQISRELAVEQATVSLYENGHRSVPLEVIERWAKLLDVSIAITPKGYEPIKAEEYEKRDLETFEVLKKRRNYLIAEMRALMAEKVMQVPEFCKTNEESGEGRFWAYSFGGDHDIGLVETRYDHPTQKFLAVEYTGEEANVYRYSPSGSFSDAGGERAYFTEDDFLSWPFGCEDMESRKSTIFRERASAPDGIELVSPEGFSVGSLWDMQEAFKRFSAVYDEVIGLESYQEMEDELLQIEGRLDDLLIDNRLGNGMPNPAFKRWTEDDEQTVSVPLNEPERIWRWIEEGVSWVDDCSGEVALRLWVDPEIHEGYEVLKDEEAKRYDRIVESARELDDLRENE